MLLNKKPEPFIGHFKGHYYSIKITKWEKSLIELGLTFKVPGLVYTF